MPQDPYLDLKRALAARIGYYNELGIYDFYRREATSLQPEVQNLPESVIQPEQREEMSPRRTVVAVRTTPNDSVLEVISNRPECGVNDPVKALKIIREDLGDCTRCVLHKQGRKQIVFGVGDPKAELMFIGEAPGADEDQQGEPFVGRAGQLLNNMIKAMGLERERVYIANIIKCRPPQNRNPEPDEIASCEPFLVRQLELIGPKVIVALGTFAAQTLLRTRTPITRLRGVWADYHGIPLMPTFHPAYLLRNPAEKRVVWQDIQQVMEALGLPR